MKSLTSRLTAVATLPATRCVTLILCAALSSGPAFGKSESDNKRQLTVAELKARRVTREVALPSEIAVNGSKDQVAVTPLGRPEIDRSTAEVLNLSWSIPASVV